MFIHRIINSFCISLSYQHATGTSYGINVQSNKTRKMRNLRNTVRLIGNVGMDPELKTLSNGNQMTRFSLATTESYTNKKGERVFDTTWHNIVAWGKTAKLAEQICKKGFKVAIDGKLSTRSYEDEKGQKKYITEIVANELMVVNDKTKEINSSVS